MKKFEDLMSVKNEIENISASQAIFFFPEITKIFIKSKNFKIIK